MMKKGRTGRAGLHVPAWFVVGAGLVGVLAWNSFTRQAYGETRSVALPFGLGTISTSTTGSEPLKTWLEGLFAPRPDELEKLRAQNAELLLALSECLPDPGKKPPPPPGEVSDCGLLETLYYTSSGLDKVAYYRRAVSQGCVWTRDVEPPTGSRFAGVSGSPANGAAPPGAGPGGGGGGAPTVFRL